MFRTRRVGWVVEGARLEIVCTFKAYLGFKSLTLRHLISAKFTSIWNTSFWKRWQEWKRISIPSTRKPRLLVPAVRSLKQLLPRKISVWKSAPNAIRSSPADRSWWIPADVLIVSTNVSVLKKANKLWIKGQCSNALPFLVTRVRVSFMCRRNAFSILWCKGGKHADSV